MKKTLIERIEVGSGGAASITFSSIPQTYDGLYLLLSFRSSRSALNDYVAVKFNASTSNYSARLLIGNGASASSGTDSSVSAPRIVGDIPASTATGTTFSNFQMTIPNYAGSNAKSVSVDAVMENNATTSYQQLNAFLWNDTTAISSITFEALAGGTNNFVQYSSASLYGVSKYNTSAAPKASGGIISYDSVNDKWVHVFAASGTFTPSENLTAEYLVVAGGGGGGSERGGGGGGGGYRSFAGQSLTASTGYTVTVGAGGAGASTTVRGGKGGNSAFDVNSSTGGGGGGSYKTNPGGADPVEGQAGGSGGGGASDNFAGTKNGGAGNEGSYTPVEGYAGGKGGTDQSTYRYGGGGGGASAVGQDGSSTNGGIGGDGGAGQSNSITGTSLTYAGGGGGGAYNSGNGGSGGSGVGGDGGEASLAATAGQTNRGGGGGGGGNAGTVAGANGGSGIVIVRYSA